MKHKLQAGMSLGRGGVVLAALCGLIGWIYAYGPSPLTESGRIQAGEHSTLLSPDMDLLALARGKGLMPPVSDDQKAFLYRFSRSGLSLETVVLTPGAVFEAEIPSIRRTTCVSVRVAMPFNLGDGVALKISTLQGGSEKVIIERHLDPVHNRQHRSWIPLDFEIPPATGPTLLRFAVNPGPKGDFAGDWLGIAPGISTSCLFSVKPISQR